MSIGISQRGMVMESEISAAERDAAGDWILDLWKIAPVMSMHHAYGASLGMVSTARNVFGRKNMIEAIMVACSLLNGSDCVPLSAFESMEACSERMRIEQRALDLGNGPRVELMCFMNDVTVDSSPVPPMRPERGKCVLYIDEEEKECR